MKARGDPCRLLFGQGRGWAGGEVGSSWCSGWGGSLMPNLAAQTWRRASVRPCSLTWGSFCQLLHLLPASPPLSSTETDVPREWKRGYSYLWELFPGEKELLKCSQEPYWIHYSFLRVEIMAKTTVTGFIAYFSWNTTAFIGRKRFTHLFWNIHCGQLEMNGEVSHTDFSWRTGRIK